MQSISQSHSILLSNSSYEIQEEGPVQEINYVSDKERGSLRIVSEEELGFFRFVIKTEAWHSTKSSLQH